MFHTHSLIRRQTIGRLLLHHAHPSRTAPDAAVGTAAAPMLPLSLLALAVQETIMPQILTPARYTRPPPASATPRACHPRADLNISVRSTASRRPDYSALSNWEPSNCRPAFNRSESAAHTSSRGQVNHFIWASEAQEGQNRRPALCHPGRRPIRRRWRQQHGKLLLATICGLGCVVLI